MSIDERELAAPTAVGPAGPDLPSGPPLADVLRSGADVLAAHEARLGERFGELVEAEDRADVAAGHTVAAARVLAAAAGVPIPRWSVDDVVVVDEAHPAVLEADHLVRVRVAELRRRASGATQRERWEGLLTGSVVTVSLAVLGWFATVRSGVIPSDAVSRVQGALAVVAGRDPHPESIGFIWGPFPTLFQVPLVALRSVWPELAARSVAAVIVSAAATGIMVAQLLAWGREVGSPRWSRHVVVLLTLASPLVLLYGANGMSEATWMCALVIAARHLARWARTDRLGSLVTAGVAIGVGYLTRYETAAAALGALVFVVVVSARRRPGDDGWERGTVGGQLGRTARRFREVALDAAILSFPIGAAVLGWSAASYLIVGEPLAQLSSEYGNSALVRAAAGVIESIIGDTSVPGRVGFFVGQLVVAAPLLVPLGLVTAWVGGRRAVNGVAAACVLGTPIVLQLVLAGSGGTFPWFRYVVGAVVLSGVLALVLTGSTPGRTAVWLRPLAVCCLIPGVVWSWGVVLRGDVGARDDQLVVEAVRTVLDGGEVPEADSVIARGQVVAAELLTDSDVVAGSVLTDASSTYAVVAAADRPEVFIIPSDRDFEAVVADPATFGVRFVLLRLPSSAGDAVVAAHPGLATDQDANFERVRTWGEDGDDSGRYVLYRVLNPRGEPRPTPDEGFLD